jgi:hypothetical protein
MIRYVVLMTILFFLGCDESVKQEYKLSDERLAQLMFDLHFADVILPGHTLEQRDTINLLYWQKLSENYGMTEEEIREEVRKLESEPEKLKLILGRVKMMSDSIQI